MDGSEVAEKMGTWFSFTLNTLVMKFTYLYANMPESYHFEGELTMVSSVSHGWMTVVL